MTTTTNPTAPAIVEQVLRDVLGDAGDGRAARRRAAEEVARGEAEALGQREAQLVYGELDVAAVARVLDAAGVEAGDRFVDVGSGDGLPTLAAALLHASSLESCRGIEIVPQLVLRSRDHERRLRAAIESGRAPPAAPTAFFEGDVYRDGEAREVLRDSTLALCFATTWAHGAPRRELAQLSTSLYEAMPRGARAILIDGRLVEGDGWRWEGDLRITTPDTAPFSTARLYVAR